MHACTCMYGHTLCPSHTLVRLASCHTCVYAHTPLLPRLRPPLRLSRPLPRLLCHRPTGAPMHSRTFTHTCAAQPTASLPSPYPRYARPPRPAQTCSHPRHALSLDKYVQTYVHSPSFARPPSLL